MPTKPYLGVALDALTAGAALAGPTSNQPTKVVEPPCAHRQ